MANHPVIIEFFGLPGAGKTTLSKHFAELLHEKGVAAGNPNQDMAQVQTGLRRKIYKLPHIRKELMYHPTCSARAAVAIGGCRQGSPKEFMQVLVNWWFVVDLLRTSKAKAHFHILEQGLCQALWSIGLNGKNGTSLTYCDDLIYDYIPLPNAVVLVEVSLETAYERLSKREGRNSRIEQVPKENQRPFLLHGMVLYQRIAQEILPRLSCLKDVAVIRVENERKADIDKATTLLLDHFGKSIS